MGFVGKPRRNRRKKAERLEVDLMSGKKQKQDLERRHGLNSGKKAEHLEVDLMSGITHQQDLERRHDLNSGKKTERLQVDLMSGRKQQQDLERRQINSMKNKNPLASRNKDTPLKPALRKADGPQSQFQVKLFSSLRWQRKPILAVSFADEPEIIEIGCPKRIDSANTVGWFQLF